MVTIFQVKSLKLQPLPRCLTTALQSMEMSVMASITQIPVRWSVTLMWMLNSIRLEHSEPELIHVLMRILFTKPHPPLRELAYLTKRSSTVLKSSGGSTNGSSQTEGKNLTMKEINHHCHLLHVHVK